MKKTLPPSFHNPPLPPPFPGRTHKKTIFDDRITRHVSLEIDNTDTKGQRHAHLPADRQFDGPGNKKRPHRSRHKTARLPPTLRNPYDPSKNDHPGLRRTGRTRLDRDASLPGNLHQQGTAGDKPPKTTGRKTPRPRQLSQRDRLSHPRQYRRKD